MTHLSVNVDHVATLREARGVDYPSPVEAGRLAEEAGASGVTVHLRGDRRHIQDRDVRDLRDVVNGKLNLEMATTDEMLALALEIRPDQVSLVPERPDEVTTEGGLDLLAQADRVTEVATELNAHGIAVSVFLDPEEAQIRRLAEIRERGGIVGFEINTDRYTRQSGSGQAPELDHVCSAARLGAENELAVYAGHGLTTSNVGPVAALPEVEELNIGHSIVSRSVVLGISEAVREMLVAIRGE